MPNSNDHDHEVIMVMMKQNSDTLVRLERKIDVGNTEVLDQIETFRDDVTNLKVDVAVTKSKLSTRTTVGTVISIVVAGVGIALASIFGK